jgi:hypothetical protein
LCACSGDSAEDGTGQVTTSASTGPGSGTGGASGAGGSGASTGTFGSGGAGSGGAPSCAQTTSEATLVSKPVDIVFVIDNSGSMTDEISEVEAQVNKTFASIIDAAVPAVDYRVILVSEHGPSAGAQSICISEPLSGVPDIDADGHCDTIPNQPVNGPKFFHHSVPVGSKDSLCKLITGFSTPDQFNLNPTGYRERLRPEAFKFFVVITDDGVNTNCNGFDFDDGNNPTNAVTAAENFDAALFALSPADFGSDAASRNYRFWSIISQAPYNPSAQKPYGDPAPPDAALAPVTASECTPDAANPGTGYQALSILTGGYRYPTCGLEYTDIFTLMAYGVIDGAKVDCEFPIPEPPMGETLDLATVQVKYSSDGMPVATFNQVATASLCTPESFYIDGETIKLCPDACGVVQADENAKVDIAYGCEIVVN